MAEEVGLDDGHLGLGLFELFDVWFDLAQLIGNTSDLAVEGVEVIDLLILLTQVMRYDAHEG